MRTQTLTTTEALATAPNPVANPSGFVLNWVDGTAVNYYSPLTWVTGSTVGSAEIGYRIERQTSSDAGIGNTFSVIDTVQANKTTYTDSTATPGVRYNYRVVAFTAAGDSASTPLLVGPALTAPAAPTIGTGMPANVSALVRWTGPADAGGSAVTGYTVKVVDAVTGVQVGALQPAAAGATSLMVTGLTNLTAYKFQVLATNAIGSSAYSALSAAGTPTSAAPVTRLSDFNSDGFTDVVARDTAGVLWLYPGDGASGLGARSIKGSGWQSYTITNAADMNGTGLPDKLARDSAGVLWFYPVTGNGVLGARTRVGAGWNGYTIMGPGDMTGDGLADILTRDPAGTLWIYRGNGAGGVTTRSSVGVGYNIANAMLTPGNVDRVNGNDLIT